MKSTAAEENYLKAIYKCSEAGETASTTRLARELSTTPASVTDMLKKLNERGMVHYTPYKGAALSPKGLQVALRVIRKRRLWETFLVNQLHFTWDNLHDIVEQLEHVESEELVNRLDHFLGEPRFDPHGDPIPDALGNLLPRNTHRLSEAPVGKTYTLAAVTLQTADFLRYLDRLGLVIGAALQLEEVLPFDRSSVLHLDGRELVLAQSTAEHLLVLPA